MKTVTLKVEGMSCGHCVSTVETALKKLLGVSTAAVDLAKKCAEVQFDETQTNEENIIRAIEKTGFEASL